MSPITSNSDSPCFSQSMTTTLQDTGFYKNHPDAPKEIYWPDIFHNITRYVNACTTCCHDKTVRHKPCSPQRFLLIPDRPWSSISMDFIKWLLVSKGFDAILVVVDQLTKMAHFIPMRSNIDAPQLTKIFLQNIFTKHGTPTDIVSNRGKHFASCFWALLCTLLGV